MTKRKDGRTFGVRDAEAEMWDARDVRARAEAGDAEAQNDLGCCYNTGNGVAVDKSEALRWIRAAAAQGNEDACFNLGLYHAHGWGGLKRDNREALKCYLLAAKKGHVGAWVNLGDLYWRGAGVTMDRAEAMRWWLKAARNREADACMIVGYKYGKGTGVRRNMAKARTWLLKAIRLGEPRAFRRLALLVLQSPGRWASASEAYLWLYAARRLGASCVRPKHLKVYASRLTPARIEALQKRAADHFSRMEIEIITVH